MVHGRPFFVWCFVLRTKTLQQEEAFFFGLFVSRTHVKKGFLTKLLFHPFY
jgi:hypothetical protein